MRRNGNQQMEAVCAVTDPFCKRAQQGAKWHDDANQPSITVSCEQLVVLTASNGGEVAFGFFPTAETPYTYEIASVVSSHYNFGTTVGTALQRMEEIYANYITSARVVSAGAEWWDVGPATEVGGFVQAIEHGNFLATSEDGLGVSAQDFTVGSAGFGLSAMVLDRRKPGSWISKPTKATSYNYGAINDTAQAFDGRGERTGLVLVATGPASTPILCVRIIVNLELVVGGFGILNRLATPPSSTTTETTVAIARRVEEKIPPVKEGSGSSWVSTIKRYVVDAAKEHGKALIGDVMDIAAGVVSPYLRIGGRLARASRGAPPMIVD
jgi:hypothetical protein